MIFNGLLKSLNISYIGICIAISASVQRTDVEPGQEILVLLIINIVMIAIMFMMPVLVGIHTMKNSDEFIEIQKDDLGSNVKNLFKIISIRRNRYNLLYYPEFYLRRFCFIMIPMVMRDLSAGNQLQVLLLL